MTKNNIKIAPYSSSSVSLLIPGITCWRKKKEYMAEMHCDGLASVGIPLLFNDRLHNTCSPCEAFEFKWCLVAGAHCLKENTAENPFGVCPLL